MKRTGAGPKSALGVALLALVLTTAAVWSGMVEANSPTHRVLTLSPGEAASEARLRAQGLLTYNDRPAAVRAVLDRMYDNDSRYHRLSALFVDHAPFDPAGSIRIEIAQQPATVRTVAFTNDNGLGVPVEETSGDYASTLIYAPWANAYLRNPHPSPTRLLPLADLPLALPQIELGPTTIFGFVATQAVLADQFIHPAGLMTSNVFNNKNIDLIGDVTFAGRPAWELGGTQVATAPIIPQTGDGWKVWVDMQTGIILRLEYYRGTALIGWAELRDLSIDGQGAALTLPALSVPSGARDLTIREYLKQAVLPIRQAQRKS